MHFGCDDNRKKLNISFAALELDAKVYTNCVLGEGDKLPTSLLKELIAIVPKDAMLLTSSYIKIPESLTSEKRIKVKYWPKGSIGKFSPFTQTFNIIIQKLTKMVGRVNEKTFLFAKQIVSRFVGS